MTSMPPAGTREAVPVIERPRERIHQPLVRRSAAGRGSTMASVADIVSVVGVVLCVAGGTAVRAWYLFNRPLTSDEAIVGLVARQVLHGHLYAFYWGQAYGGAEPYMAAAVFAVFGQSSLTLDLAAGLLSVAAGVLVWRVALRLVHDRRLAALAGALAWAAPIAAAYQGTYAGFRGAVMVCGLGTVLFALRLLDGRRSYADVVGLGLFAGVGWWAAPEVVYYFVPAAGIIGGAVWSSRDRLWWWVGRTAVGVVAFCVGALPWLYDNAKSRLASLQTSKFTGASTPLHGFVGRIRTFFEDALPLQMDLRRFGSGEWLVGVPGSSALHRVLLVVLLVAVLGTIGAAIVLCALRGGRAWAVVAALLAFPLVSALDVGSWFWQDGRYDEYLGTLVVLALAIGAEELFTRRRGALVLTGAREAAPGPDARERAVRAPRRTGAAAMHQRSAWSRLAMCGIAVGGLVLALVDFDRSTGVSPSTFAQGWGNANTSSVATADALEAAGIHYGYAQYWVAYKLDFISGGRLGVTVGGSTIDRWLQLNRDVETSSSAAWLFITPPQLPTGFAQFGATPTIQGPGGLSETRFIAALQRLGIPYRVVRADIVTAVVPKRPVTPAKVGLVGLSPSA